MGRAHNFIDRRGEKHISNEGEHVVIIEYFNAYNCTIQFEDGTIVNNLQYNNIKNSQIKNPLKPSVLGVGYFGIGKHVSSIGGKPTKCHNTWRAMIRRCYSKEISKNLSTYKECFVIKEWKCFQVFGDWFEENWKPWMDSFWQLDKDILTKGNKIYSPETCCFVPPQINSLFVKSNSIRGKYPIGVTKSGNRFAACIYKYGEPFDLGTFLTPEGAFYTYKIEKELHIKEVADKWRGQITEPCYEAMYAYEVEITD